MATHMSGPQGQNRSENQPEKRRPHGGKRERRQYSEADLSVISMYTKDIGNRLREEFEFTKVAQEARSALLSFVRQGTEYAPPKTGLGAGGGESLCVAPVQTALRKLDGSLGSLIEIFHPLNADEFACAKQLNDLHHQVENMRLIMRTAAERDEISGSDVPNVVSYAVDLKRCLNDALLTMEVLNLNRLAAA